MEKRRYSVLAILETIGAMAVYGWIAFRVGTLHLTVAACIAPFLLLRTDRSTALALTWWSALFRDRQRGTRSYKVMSALLGAGFVAPLLALGFAMDHPRVDQLVTSWPEWIQAVVGIGAFVLAFTALPVIVILVLPATVIRVASTIAATLRSPVESLRAIPTNWERIALCTDLGVLPEMIPGAQQHLAALPKTALLVPASAARFIVGKVQEEGGKGIRRAEQRWTGRRAENQAVLARLEGRSRVIRWLARGIGATRIASAGIELVAERYFSRVLLLVMSVAFRASVVLMCLPSWLYRWSIKGTSLLLAPMLWLANDTEEQEPRQVAESLFMQHVNYLSWGILLLAAGRGLDLALEIDFGLFAPYREFITMKDAHGIIPAFFPENAVPVWQWLLLVCAAVTVFAVHYADRVKNKPRAHTAREKAVLDTAMILVGILAVATIFALIHTSASLVRVGLPTGWGQL